MATGQDTAEVSADTFAAQLGDKFLHCRELGHNWQPHSAEYDRASRTYDRIIRCRTCRTVRHQLLDSTGAVLSNGYRYPDGYLAQHVQSGSLSRDVFRLEAVERSLHLNERRAG